MAQSTTIPFPGITTGNYFFLKGRFKATSSNIYGIFMIMFNPQKQMETYNASASTFSNVFDLEPRLGWDIFEEKIAQSRWHGNCHSSMTNAVISVFENINKDARLREELYTLISSYNFSQIEIALFDAFNRVIRDKGAIIETGIQEATTEEVLAVREQKNKIPEKEIPVSSPDPSDHDFEVEENAAIVPASMMLSPVRGKQLYDLKIGDRIMLKFDPKTGPGSHYISLFNLTTPNGKIKPVPGEVIDMRSDKKDQPVKVLTRIADKLYGLSTEEERHVRVCLYDPKIDGLFKPGSIKGSQNIRSAQASAPKPAGYSSTTYLLMGVAAFILVIVIMLIYILV